MGDNAANDSQLSLGGSNGNSYLPIAKSSDGSGNTLRVNGINEPAGSSVLFDGESIQSVVTRDSMYDKLIAKANIMLKQTHNND